MRTAAILPVKRFGRAKQRLGGSVTESLRLDLARAMVADVLGALGETRAIEVTIVVTCEESLAEAAAAGGALVVEDVEDAGQSAAAELGAARALAEGIERILCVPGDCPALEPAELELLLAPARAGGSGEAGGEREVVIVPDRHGTGTNGLLLSPPDAIAPSFGPGSFERHRALALAAGLRCRIERPPSLLLDIDTGADLAVLRERLAGDRPASRPERATRTRGVLSGSDGAGAAALTTSA
ncbi:MAG TPA: 2-phospho-L-lactate guanylyltransferase [Solirubrobacteraceae bacterium]|jgi:2-phospho-L-lactate guanylyltransferase|nr:2-phospho-L-lactate guanylyltransferase [Solirubrobacteraceae bacterium]